MSQFHLVLLFKMILPNIGALAVVCWIMGVRNTASQDASPRPKLSVDTYGASKLYVKDKQNVKISCSIGSAYLKSNDYGYLEFRRNGTYLSQTCTKPGYPESITQYAPVLEGEYECVFHLISSKIKLTSQPSNSAFICIYNPPDPVPIVAGVLTTAVGVAILVYICRLYIEP